MGKLSVNAFDRDCFFLGYGYGYGYSYGYAPWPKNATKLSKLVVFSTVYFTLDNQYPHIRSFIVP